MYFLEHIRNNFTLLLMLWVGWPDGAVEQSREIESQAREEEGPKWPDDVIRMAQEAEWLESRAGDIASIWRDALDWENETQSSLSFWSNVPSWEKDAMWYSLDWANLSEAWPVQLWNGPRDEYHMWERVSSPEEIALLWRLSEGEIWFDDPDVAALAEELWMKEVLRTAGIDGLELWEVPEWIEESTPEMLNWSRTEVQSEIDTINSQIRSLPEWSPQRENLERRSSFLEWFIQVIVDAIEWKQPWVDGWAWGFSGVDVVWDRNVMARWMAHRWIHERTWEADKFLMWLAQDARQTPWCAWFVSYVCTEAWYDITPTLSSKAFIWETGKWHVAFYAWNGQMLWGNQSNSVSLAPIRKDIQGWTMPADLEAWRQPNRWWTPPVGAIIVFNRWWSDRNMA